MRNEAIPLVVLSHFVRFESFFLLFIVICLSWECGYIAQLYGDMSHGISPTRMTLQRVTHSPSSNFVFLMFTIVVCLTLMARRASGAQLHTHAKDEIILHANNNFDRDGIQTRRAHRSIQWPMLMSPGCDCHLFSSLQHRPQLTTHRGHKPDKTTHGLDFSERVNPWVPWVLSKIPYRHRPHTQQKLQNHYWLHSGFAWRSLPWRNKCFLLGWIK